MDVIAFPENLHTTRGSILLVSTHQNKTPVDHFIGHIPFASFKGDKRQDKIHQYQESLNILFPKQENNVSIFRAPPLIKIICLFAAGQGGSLTYLHMTNF